MKRENQEREEACQAYSGPSIRLSDVQCEVQCPPAGSLIHMRRVKYNYNIQFSSVQFSRSVVSDSVTP